MEPNIIEVLNWSFLKVYNVFKGTRENKDNIKVEQLHNNLIFSHNFDSICGDIHEWLPEGVSLCKVELNKFYGSVDEKKCLAKSRGPPRYKVPIRL